MKDLPNPNFGHRLRAGIAVWLVPVLLLLVAGRQFYLAQTQLLTPWLGGGFGMFASIDRIDHRVVRAYAITEDSEIPLLLPRLDDSFRTQMKARMMPAVVTRTGYEQLWDLQVQEMKTRAMPTKQRLIDLLDQLGRLPWKNPDKLPIRLVEQPPDWDPTQIRQFRVEVWRLWFNPATKEVSAEILGSRQAPANFQAAGNQNGGNGEP